MSAGDSVKGWGTSPPTVSVDGAPVAAGACASAAGENANAIVATNAAHVARTGVFLIVNLPAPPQNRLESAELFASCWTASADLCASGSRAQAVRGRAGQCRQCMDAGIRDPTITTGTSIDAGGWPPISIR